MPGLGAHSPGLDYRTSPSIDRELTLNSLRKNKSPSFGGSTESGLYGGTSDRGFYGTSVDRGQYGGSTDRGVFSSDRFSLGDRTNSRSSLLDKSPNDRLERPGSGRNSINSPSLKLGGDRKLYGSSGLGVEDRETPGLRSGSNISLTRASPSHGRTESHSGGRSSALRTEPRGHVGPGGLLAHLADTMGEAEEEGRGSSQNKHTSQAKKKKRKNPVTANLSGTRYDVVRQMAERLGLTVVRDDDPNSFLLWNDAFVSTDRITELKPYQRINHFPGMGEICRKDCLARNMAKIAKVYPDEFNFVPKTWILPSEYSALQNYSRELKKKKKSKSFIVKPANGAMGNGISLYRNAEKIPQNDHFIVQEYLDKPFLVEGFKCDMRIYVLVTSVDPLRIFLYYDGLLRMSTEKYTHPSDTNMDQLYMHLTNYSVNKHNENYNKSGSNDTGSKRTLKFFNDYLRRNEYDVAYLWRNITDLIIKTMIVAHPHVLHAYRMCRPGQAPGSDSVCFEVLGFDVMVDRKLRPWLIEINRSPSFGTDEKLDYDIKSGVIYDSLRLLNIKASDKRKNMAAQKAQAQKRLLRPTKRVDGESSELEKKRQSVEKKKEELKDILTRLRKDASREEFENRNCGHFKRIFPPEDKFRREKYAAMLSEAYGVFMSGRATSLQQEIHRTYNNLLREEDILDMLAQCEADEKEGRTITTNRPPRGPKTPYPSSPPKTSPPSHPTHKPDIVNRTLSTLSGHSLYRLHPLVGMPGLAKDPDPLDDEDAEDDDDYDEDTEAGTKSRTWGQSSPGRSDNGGATRGNRSKRPPSSNKSKQEGEPLMTAKEVEEQLSKHTLVALNDMRIKFPGKTDEEADYLLDKLHENWKFHKPRIASYWLVKLDSIKRRKVIDIVRSNVRAVLQRTWKSSEIEQLRIYRIVNRVFNRLLWSHGQGLWNCFNEQSGNSWETIFNKSTEPVTGTELACCRRIVQLCRDCLLIVYQFAADAKSAASQASQVEQHLDSHGTSTGHNRGRDSVTNRSNYSNVEKPGTWNPANTISQRLSRIYNNRSQSLNTMHGPS